MGGRGEEKERDRYKGSEAKDRRSEGVGGRGRLEDLRNFGAVSKQN